MHSPDSVTCVSQSRVYSVLHVDYQFHGLECFKDAASWSIASEFAWFRFSRALFRGRLLLSSHGSVGSINTLVLWYFFAWFRLAEILVEEIFLK